MEGTRLVGERKSDILGTVQGERAVDGAVLIQSLAGRGG